MALILLDRIKQAITSGGTGVITLGAAASGFQSLGAAHNGELMPYTIEEGANWETGTGIYTHTGTSFSRTNFSASSTGSAVNFTTAAVFFVGLNAVVCAPLTTTSGTNTGDETTARIGTLTAGATAKATPADADTFGLADSTASNILRSLTWANLKIAIQNFLSAANKLLPSLTAGSIPFSDGTTLAQDNENLRWDNANKRFGVGTGAIPQARLHSISTSEQLRLGYDSANYLSTTVSAIGATVIAATGSGASITFGSRVIHNNPIKLPAYAEASLPSAATFSGSMAYTSDTRRVVVSDGAAWQSAGRSMAEIHAVALSF